MRWMCFFVCFLLGPLLLAGCPATPPSGPAEIPGPVALRFPSSVTIDVSTTASGEFETLRLMNKAFLGSSGEFSDEIARGSDFARFIGDFVDRVISSEGILGDVEVAIDSSITNFTSTVASDSEVFAGEELKIDFSKFTSAKDETQNCSGSTEGGLVCFRVWVGGKKILGGFFTSIPTDNDDGAGHIWFIPLPEIFADEGEPPEEDFEIGVRWDHTDLSDKTTEMFGGGGVSSTTTLDMGRILLRQEGEDELEATKTVKMRFVFESTGPPGGISGSEKYVGRWKENEDFWSGKVDFESTFSNVGNLDICARLSTGNGVADGNCAGIDTDNEEFLDLPDEDDFHFPTDFPSSPTF